MNDEMFSKIILKNVINTPKAQFVIYGTKDIGEIYYNYFKEKYGEECIAFFIDGKKENDFFKEKKVFTCDELRKLNYTLNEYIYIIGTVSKIPLFINNLVQIGVHSDNIINPITYFSANYIDSNIQHINNIYIYPKIEDKETLENILKKIMNYIPSSLNNEKKIYLSTNLEIEDDFEKVFSIVKEPCIAKNNEDITLIWNADNLLDRDIKDNGRVFCFDEKIVFHLEIKILVAILGKFTEFNNITYYRGLSKQNYIKMLDRYKGYKQAIICGGGPSLTNLKKDFSQLMINSLVVVCNGIYRLKEIYKEKKPDIYILQDNSWLIEDYRMELNQIIKYVKDEDMFLCVNERWLPVLCSLYDDLENNIIGLREVEKNTFPSVDNLSYTESTNVVTSIAIPITSSLVDKIFFIGCDGMDNGNWTHAYTGRETEEFVPPQVVLPYDYCIDNFEYNSSLDELYKRVLEYGESLNKNYYSLTHSYLHELEKRLWNEHNG